MSSKRRPKADASSFLHAMEGLNEQHPPDQVAGPVQYAPLEPLVGSSRPMLQPSAVTDIPSSAADDAPATSGPTALTPVDPFIVFARNVQSQIDALIALPEAERRRQNKIQTAGKANNVCMWIERRWALARMRPMMKPEAYGKYLTDIQYAAKFIFNDYLTHFALTFRFNDLPVELLTEIFRLVVWPLTAVERDVKAAIRLTHVCRLWRSVAIADRQLWSPVCFVDPRRYERSFALMERAGPSGLDIRIRDVRARPISKEAMGQLIERIFERLSTIRKLDIFLFSREAVTPILNGLQRIAKYNIPMELEYFEIHSFYSSGVPPDVLPTLPLFGGTIIPSFRHLRLNGVNVQWDVNLLSRLTTLDIRRIAMCLLPSSADFRAILRGATGLEKMILDGAGPKYEPGAFSLPPIPIPTLRILVLGGLSDAYAEYVLSHFTSPNVLDLSVMFPINNVYTKFVTALTTTFQMPKVKILILVKMPLHGQPIQQESKTLLAKWLESMPDLTFLRLLHTTDELFEILKYEETRKTPAPTSAPAIPEPKRLICPKVIYMDCQNDLAYFHALTDWIEHRRLMGYPLKKVWLANDDVKRLTHEQKAKLLQALGGVGTALIASHRTLEEATMCKQV